MASLLSEFKRRNVFKVGAVYLVVAWGLIQIADILAPQLNLPDWAPNLITFIALLGFPLALLLAWAFDLTPDGIKAESHSATDKRIYIGAGVLIAAAISWYVLEEPAVETGSGGIASRSIAVLPFLNMSGDPQNEYFSEGISEEVLNVLAQIPGLHVAARTSSFSFKDESMEIPEIARELDVALILEGSVRRQDDRVRITAQLIDAASGFHLWSDTYDRDLRDIFATQDEIAAAVAQALELELSGSDNVFHERQTHPDDYDKYLRARVLEHDRGEARLRQAITMFEEVIAADPMFAEAYAGLGVAYVVLPFYSTEPREAMHRKARNAAEVALALNPGLSEAYSILGDVAAHSLRFDDADMLLRRAIESGPSLPLGYKWFAEKEYFVGNLDEALSLVEKSVVLDPQSRARGYMLAMMRIAKGQTDAARTSCENVLINVPDFELCRGALLLVALGTKDYDEFHNVLMNSPNTTTANDRKFAQSITDALRGKADRDDLIQTLMDTPHHAVYDTENPGILLDTVLPALILALGEPELAVERLALNASNEPKNALDVIWDPQLDPIRCTDGFQDVVKRLRIVDKRAEEACAR